MIQRAVESARKHNINISQGTQNSANGNCAFESVLFNINDRKCFSESFPFSPDYYRRIWLTDFKIRTAGDKTVNIYSPQQWEAGWSEMMESGVYERDLFGDLMLFGIACGIRKMILILNTSLDSPHDPIYVCDPRRFGVQPNSNVPVLLAYDMSHYESLHTLNDSDIQKTTALVDQYLTGNYPFKRKDLPFLLATDILDVSENEDKTHDLVKLEDRSKGLELFQDSLPEHLRGRKPKDMNPEEKREYDNLRRKISRKNESLDKSLSRKKQEADSKTASRKHETEEVKQNRNTIKSKATGRKRKEETEAEKEQRLLASKEATAKKRKEESEAQKRKIKLVKAQATSKKRKKESETEKSKRNSTKAKATAKKRKEESQMEKEKRNVRDNKATAKKRKEESVAKKRERNLAKAQATLKKRKEESEAEKYERNSTKAKATAKKRKEETQMEKERRNVADTRSTANKRKEESEAEKKDRNTATANAASEKRKLETDEEARKRKQQRAIKRAQKIPLSQYDARNAQKVLAGEKIIDELKDTVDNIGNMIIVCISCNAKKWKNEPPTLCCNSGKVDLPIFPDPPNMLKDLLTNNTEEGKLFRKNTRPLNNALAL